MYMPTPRLWVDYENWRCKREWREIIPIGAPKLGLYPANGPNGCDQINVWIMQVRMVDRDMATRTLRMTSIHGFYVGDQPPVQTKPTYADRLIESANDALAIAKGQRERSL